MMRSFALPLAIGLTLAAAVGPDEVRIAYGPYVARGSSNFRAETQMVETSAVVRDEHERAVDHLQKQDFRILDNGKEREIKSFVVERADAGAPESAPPRVIALVFDNIAAKLACNSISPKQNVLAVASIAHMKDAAAKFVRTNLRPVDRISLIGLDGGQMAPFTNDAATLLAAIGKVTLYQTCIQPRKLLTIEDVVDNMARLRGDRSIVICSYGFAGLLTVRDAVVEKAIRGEVPIHTLDVHGAGFLDNGTFLGLPGEQHGRPIPL
jgi:VWFA-related protein